MYPPVSVSSGSLLDTRADRLRQVMGVPKDSAEDTTFTTYNAAGEKVIVPVPEGTIISLHIAGLHYNRTILFRDTEVVLNRDDLSSALLG